MSGNKTQYIYHPGTGTLIAAAECTIIELDDTAAEAVLDGEKEVPRGQTVDSPYQAVSFTGRAIREHYENHDNAEFIEGLSDGDLTEAGEWAIEAGFMWDSVYAAWDFGVESVRKEREAGLDGPA